MSIKLPLFIFLALSFTLHVILKYTILMKWFDQPQINVSLPLSLISLRYMAMFELRDKLNVFSSGALDTHRPYLVNCQDVCDTDSDGSKKPSTAGLRAEQQHAKCKMTWTCL
jgi:hypothetical protein